MKNRRRDFASAAEAPWGPGGRRRGSGRVVPGQDEKYILIFTLRLLINLYCRVRQIERFEQTASGAGN